MRNSNNFYPQGRLFMLAIVGFIVLGYIVVAYARLAAIGKSEESAHAEAVERGIIFDRNGKTLAVPTSFYHIALTPDAIIDIPYAARILSPVIDMSEQAIIERINNANGNFLYLKKKINENEHENVAKAIQDAGLQGIHFDKIPGRIYPEGALASQLVGFMGDSGTGLSGVEYSLQNVLSPQVTTDSPSNRSGQNVYLSIDANLQYRLGEIGRKTMEETGAESFTLLAADAKTGEILSYLSLPEADLNQYTISSDRERLDRPAVIAYEPGSVFKIFSVASLLSSGIISENETFFCGGSYLVPGGSPINCLGSHGSITARDALKYSCNVALARMAEKADSASFINAYKSLGFGSKTGIELPSETSGTLKSPTDKSWSARSKPTISIGQEISVSALQMLEAATAIANNGIPLKLTVVSRIVDRSGTAVFTHAPEKKERALAAWSAASVLSYMETTASTGTGSKASIGDVRIGVKTGTAQMYDNAQNSYSSTDFVSNCIAIFPVEDPKIILYIVVTKAQGETLSGRIVAPVIAEAANVIIDYTGMTRQNAASIFKSPTISISLPPPLTLTGQTLPDFTGVSKSALVPLLQVDSGLQFIINGQGWVVNQNPPAGTPITQGMTIELNLE
ncbi:MAG: penicillin-binding protein [Treponemataceae bacterium]|nr:MAG: penicillin-binding protein [Treponemataceae bacterium]